MEAVEPRWQKSSYSGNGGNCVEVADSGSRLLVRDSKEPEGVRLLVSAEAWRIFTSGLKTE